MVFLTEALSNFLAHLQLRNYSLRTISESAKMLKPYLRYLAETGVLSVNQLTKEANAAYVRDQFYFINQYGRQNTIKVRNNQIMAIKMFLRYLEHAEVLPVKLSEELVYYKEPTSQLPKDILSKQELLRLFKKPDLATLTGYRDRTILEILYATGMRRFELVNLQVGDIRFDDQLVFIRQGKGAKDRFVPVNQTALSFAAHYLSHVRPALMKSKPKSNQFLVAERSPVVTVNYVNDWLSGYFTGFKKRITPHSLRHTLATHLIQKGMPLRHVQELLGHERLNTTIRYLQLSIKDLQLEYRKCHPRERGV